MLWNYPLCVVGSRVGNPKNKLALQNNIRILTTNDLLGIEFGHLKF